MMGLKDDKSPGSDKCTPQSSKDVVLEITLMTFSCISLEFGTVPADRRVAIVIPQIKNKAWQYREFQTSRHDNGQRICWRIL